MKVVMSTRWMDARIDGWVGGWMKRAGRRRITVTTMCASDRMVRMSHWLMHPHSFLPSPPIQPPTELLALFPPLAASAVLCQDVSVHPRPPPRIRKNCEESLGILCKCAGNRGTETGHRLEQTFSPESCQRSWKNSSRSWKNHSLTLSTPSFPPSSAPSLFLHPLPLPPPSIGRIQTLLLFVDEFSNTIE